MICKVQREEVSLDIDGISSVLKNVRVAVDVNIVGLPRRIRGQQIHNVYVEIKLLAFLNALRPGKAFDWMSLPSKVVWILNRRSKGEFETSLRSAHTHGKYG